MQVVSNPAYPGRRTTVGDAVDRLRRLAGSPDHEFWDDDLSFLDRNRFDPSHPGGHREVTDTYLLGLAVKRDGALVTFDRNVQLEAVVGAASDHLTVLLTEA